MIVLIPKKLIQAGVDKRKFLIKKLLKHYTFTEDSDDEGMKIMKY